MDKYLLDTCTWIEFFHRRSGVGVHISQLPKDQIFASEVSIAELSAGDFDILIAVTARHYGLTVVTHNIKHFGQMPGVQCIDWVE